MKSLTCAILGAPVQCGASQPGCLMGPDAFRTAGLAATLEALGHRVEDLGNAAPGPHAEIAHANPAVHGLGLTRAWAETLERAAHDACGRVDMPIFLGGDHSLALGTVPGVARHWRETGRDLFVLWLDAHPDIHSLDTTVSGNLHGTPVCYFAGLRDFSAGFAPPAAPVDPRHICMIGIRSVDPEERNHLAEAGIEVHDMRSLDENGVKAPLQRFLDRVRAADGALHVSLDVDFLDPGIAPGVGTTVPGGATFREAHLVMELLHESGLVTSLDLVELNPFLDERGRTASLMVDLTASLMGRTVLDRPTRSN